MPIDWLSAETLSVECLSISSVALVKVYFAKCPINCSRQRARHSIKSRILIMIVELFVKTYFCTCLFALREGRIVI